MFCTLSRYRISRHADGEPAPGALVRWHVRRCAACRRFEEDLSLLGRRLARDADRVAPSVSADLHLRIVQAIGAADEPARPVRILRGDWTLRLVAAAAAVLLLVVPVAYLLVHSGDATAPRGREIARVAPPATVFNAGDYLPDLLDSPSRALAEVSGPLHQEFQNLAESGKQAAGFVLHCATFFQTPDHLPLLDAPEDRRSNG